MLKASFQINFGKTIDLYVETISSLATLFDYLKINFFIIGKDGVYIARNETLTGIVGDTDRADIVDAKAWESCLKVMETGENEIVEEEYLGRCYSSIKAPLIENKEIVGVIGISTDITDKKQAEIAKTEFLENMKHDLRTPFSGIISMTEYLQNKETDPGKKEMLSFVLNSGKQLLSLLNETLELASLGGHSIKNTQFSLPDILTKLVQLVKPEAMNKGLELIINSPEISIETDQMRIERILLSLITNAIKYTEKGYVKVTVNNKPTLSIHVEDSGIGIPEDKFEVIFDKFTKLEPSYTQNHYTGAGLGLCIARQFARELGGEISVKSELGKGSCFSFSMQ